MLCVVRRAPPVSMYSTSYYSAVIHPYTSDPVGTYLKHRNMRSGNSGNLFYGRQHGPHYSKGECPLKLYLSHCASDNNLSSMTSPSEVWTCERVVTESEQVLKESEVVSMDSEHVYLCRFMFVGSTALLLEQIQSTRSIHMMNFSKTRSEFDHILRTVLRTPSPCKKRALADSGTESISAQIIKEGDVSSRGWCFAKSQFTPQMRGERRRAKAVHKVRSYSRARLCACRRCTEPQQAPSSPGRLPSHFR